MGAALRSQMGVRAGTGQEPLPLTLNCSRWQTSAALGGGGNHSLQVSRSHQALIPVQFLRKPVVHADSV